MREHSPVTASYALDIGRYTLGVDERVLSGTTAAWARLTTGIASFHQLPAVGKSGSSIPCLAKSVNADLASGCFVALGFEAPMWLPIRRGHSRSLRLFAPRFSEERQHEWYVNAGAAATLKALSLGIMLFSLIRAGNPNVRLTTDTGCTTPNAIALFEAFVVEDFKLPKHRKSARVIPSDDEWDAFLASLAWGAIKRSFSVPASTTPRLLHAAGSEPAEILSIWRTIASNVPSLSPVGGPPDCDVVALAENTSARTRPLQ